MRAAAPLLRGDEIRRDRRFPMLRSRVAVASLLFASALVFTGVSFADQILEIYNASLTTFLPSGKTKVQNVRPRKEQRGVNIDGSMRSAPGIPAAIAGN